MTSIASSLFPFYSNGVNGASQLSSIESLLSEIDPSQNQDSASTDNNIFGDSYSLNLSNAALGALGNGGAPVVPASLDGSSFENATLADGGPLPAFLAYVDKQMNLSSTQQLALQNIANENMDITTVTPTAINTIAAEIAQAGISETI